MYYGEECRQDLRCNAKTKICQCLTPMRENIRRTKAVLDRIEHELRLDRTTAYQVALHEVMAMDKERQTLDAITDCLEKLLPSNFCKDIK